jgi:peptidoglycan hydrolase-like protein with peptidoglycan-binding domain
MSENRDNMNANRSGSASSGMSSSMGYRSSSMHDASAVRDAQQALNSQGFDAGAVDGKMGPHTQAALRKFQNAKGLQATGQLDSQTMAALGISQPAGSSTTGSNATSERTAAANTGSSNTAGNRSSSSTQ